MKELEPITQIVSGTEQQQRKELKKVNELFKHPGQTLWEFNTVTGELAPAKYTRGAVVIEGTAVKAIRSESSKLIMKDNCLYVLAINKKNAMRHINKTKLFTFSFKYI